MDTLPKTVETFRARADAGFYCWEAVKAYTDRSCEFVIVARKTDRLLGEFVGRVTGGGVAALASYRCGL
jgi:hypothetical protein